MTLEEFSVEAELAPERPDLVLEQVAQRLDELELHPLGKPPDVVMGLDDRGGAAHGLRFDAIRKDRSLRQELHVAEPRRLILEDVDEGLAHDPPLVLGIDDSLQPLQEEIAVAKHADV